MDKWTANNVTHGGVDWIDILSGCLTGSVIEKTFEPWVAGSMMHSNVSKIARHSLVITSSVVVGVGAMIALHEFRDYIRKKFLDKASLGCSR